MPTSLWMPAHRRAVVALSLALTLCLIAPAAAVASPGTSSTSTSTTKPPAHKLPTTTSGPSTTTTTLDPKSVPPPPAFTLPLELGLQLLAQRDQANLDLKSFGGKLPLDRANERVVEGTWRALKVRLDQLEARVRQTQDELDTAHADIQAAAVEAYMNSGSNRLEAAITAIASASSAMDASRTMHLIGSFGDQQDELIQQYLALQKRLTVEQKEVSDRKHAADALLVNAKSKVSDDQTAIAHAHVRLVASVIGISKFEAAATSASSPILGPSELTAQQMADFVRASGFKPRITVPLGTLAHYYITRATTPEFAATSRSRSRSSRPRGSPFRAAVRWPATTTTSPGSARVTVVRTASRSRPRRSVFARRCRRCGSTSIRTSR